MSKLFFIASTLVFDTKLIFDFYLNLLNYTLLSVKKDSNF